ncbi:hypothetical protein M9H77_17255 [Catharanthus roseus]|uniref:Uncharacterized protein n=1 Tax=Catharanthus roseus TaxID=4058 RepID=A0ACC0B4B4_CATRO|nr:hypothetical protein M9H77_17255 [Catharanthus roseus]
MRYLLSVTLAGGAGSERDTKEVLEEGADLTIGSIFCLYGSSLNEKIKPLKTLKTHVLVKDMLRCPPKVKTMKGNENRRKRQKWSRQQQFSNLLHEGHWKNRPNADGRPRPTVGGRVLPRKKRDELVPFDLELERKMQGARCVL